MIDFRAHLASIVAVFFALGLGMLVGAQLADEGALAQEYSRLIEQIEAGLERTRQHNRELERRVAEAESRLAEENRFVEEVLEEMFGGLLHGVAVQLVAEEPEELAEGRIRAALLQAGAAVLEGESAAEADAKGSGEPPPVRIAVRADGAAVGDGGDVTVTGAATFRGLHQLVQLLRDEGRRHGLVAGGADR